MKKALLKRNLKKLNIYLKILFYKEDNLLIAHALEMDLKGYGKTKEEAEKKLEELIKMQLSFAVFKNDLSLIYHPAEPRFFMLFEQIKEQYLKTFKEDNDYSIENLSINRLHPFQSSFYAQTT